MTDGTVNIYAVQIGENRRSMCLTDYSGCGQNLKANIPGQGRRPPESARVLVLVFVRQDMPLLWLDE